MSLEEGANCLVHYIKIALARELTPDMHRELGEAVQAFKDADKSLYQLHSHHP